MMPVLVAGSFYDDAGNGALFFWGRRDDVRLGGQCCCSLDDGLEVG